MNKVLIVGHGSSHYQKLEKILQICGMAKALPSYTYQMTPQALTAKLSQVSQGVAEAKRLSRTSRTKKTNDIKAIDDSQSNSNVAILLDNYSQKTPKKIWDNLAFDLILANSDQSFWGWSDSKAISLLEYWANFDDEMAFILTYDKPDNVLKDMLKSIDIQDLTSTIIQEKIQEWIDYNQALIDFYQKYPKRCLLVNGEQVIQSAKDYIQSVSQKISWEMEVSDIEKSVQKSLGNVLSDELSSQKMIDFFIQQLLQQHQDSVQSFTKIQDFADIPLAIADNTAEVENTLALLKQAMKQQQTLTTAEEKIQHYQTTLEQTNQKSIQEKQQFEKQLNEQKQKAQQDINQQKKQVEQAQFKLKELQAELQKAQQNQQISANVQQENELLIAQLHQVQEELEKYYLENQRLKASQTKSIQSAKPIYYGAADRVKQDLPYRLGATMVSHSKSTKDLAKLPFALVQEYREFQKTHVNQEELPPIEEYQDAYEAEKVKKHLSYKLGKTLVDSVKSPKSIWDLPVKMGKEIVGFKK